MALSHEETTDLRDTYALMTAEELRGQKGEDADHDALIDEILGEGKAVELKSGPLPTPEDDDAEDLPVVKAGNEPDDEDDDEEEEAAPAPAAPAAEAAAPVEPTVDTPAAELPAVEIPPLDLSYLAEKFDAKLGELDATNAADLAKMMEGEITAAEYAAKQSQYLRDRDGLRDQKAAEAQWGASVHAFQTQAAKETGINYFADTEKAEALDGWVKHLANNPKNADKPGEWFMQEAHKKVLVEFGIAAPTANTPAKPAENAVAAKKVAAKTARTPNLSNIPPTLSGLPAAASAASGDGGEFDHVMSLSGMNLEKAIAAMTPAQRERFESE